MKKITLILVLINIISCVQTDDFKTPELEINEPDITANTTISAIKNSYEQSGEKIYAFGEKDNAIIEGFVISSDKGGNFYKTIVIQDKSENPTSGIKVLIDLKANFTKYNFGRKIYIKMAGMSMAKEGEDYRMGYHIRNELVAIPETLIGDVIIRSNQVEEIFPKNTDLDKFNSDNLNTFVKINNLQFKHNEIGKTFAGEPNDKYDGERILVACKNQITTTLSTSTYSDFKSNLLPEGKGEISAVLTQDFYGEKYILVVNDPSSIDFSDNERCDPSFLYCENFGETGNEIIFFENFEEIKKTKDLEELGWKNVNINLGNEKFEKRSSLGNVAMRISAYDTKENPLEAWLVTPEINLDNSANEVFTFKSKASYDNGTILTTWVSDDFNGNIEESTWHQLDVKISVGPKSSSSDEFESSGKINLGCLSGNIHIAIRYLGGDPGISTTYDVDEFLVVGSKN